jgi:hypothetical protein
MRLPESLRKHDKASVDRSPDGAADQVQAWEQIEEGRYMPRRTRGSFPGRELG